MSVDGFLRGFKRFVARRGIPDLIINDNFKTFKSAEVKKFMLLVGVTQKFILPASPWWGGFYERLVRSVKTCLKKTIGRALVTYEELQTVLCEVEAVINSRPLAYISEDDLDEALTPSSLIMHGRNIGKRTQSIDFVFPSDVDQCKRRLNHIRKVLKDFWMRAAQGWNELPNSITENELGRTFLICVQATNLILGTSIIVFLL